jgi:hypothetical protein
MKNTGPSTNSNLPEIVSLTEANEVFSCVMNFFRECEITKRETARYDAAVKIITTEINRKYDLWEKVFTEIFKERRVSILKTFEIIDKGMEKNDKELINMGLMGLSTIVVSSPFADIDKMINAINTGQKITL